jgi:hypothetical protein
MKLQTLTLALLAVSVSGFAPVSTSKPIISRSASGTTTTSLDASRRQMLEGLLLAAAGATALSPLAANAESRPMYLTDPTEEFKANEAKAMEFKRVQLAQKKKFLDAIDRLLGEKEDETALEGDVRALQALVIETQGLPVGIKKDDLYKQIRSKKAKGYWPTKVEIA